MNINAEIFDYIENHIDPEPANLHELERSTNLHLINGRMCSGHLQGRLLKMLVGMIQPKRVLELGTFSGYSALCIAEGLVHDAILDTVETDDELEDFIRDAFAKSPHGNKIALHIDDAIRWVEGADTDSYDLIFMDADKRQYPEYYEKCLRILRPGGYIFADNTLWDGHVLHPDDPKDRQTAAICKFNDLVARDPRVERVIIPLRDGLTIIRKLKEDAPRL